MPRPTAQARLQAAVTHCLSRYPHVTSATAHFDTGYYSIRYELAGHTYPYLCGHTRTLHEALAEFEQNAGLLL